MEIFLNDFVDIRNLAITNGIRLVVHNQTHWPDYYDGILAATGSNTHVRVTRKFSSSLEQPYSECTSDITPSSTSKLVQLLLENGYAYNQRDCIYTCYQFYLIDQCGCFDYASPLPASTFTQRNIRPCNNITQISCDGKVREDFNLGGFRVLWLGFLGFIQNYYN